MFYIGHAFHFSKENKNYSWVFVVHACNLSTKEAEAAGWPQFKPSLNYIAKSGLKGKYKTKNLVKQNLKEKILSIQSNC